VEREEKGLREKRENRMVASAAGRENEGGDKRLKGGKRHREGGKEGEREKVREGGSSSS